MGKIKKGIFLFIGLFFTFWMVPNYMLGEHPVIGPYIILMGLFITMLPLFNRPLRFIFRRFYGVISKTAYTLTFAGLAVIAILTVIMVSAAYDRNIPDNADVIVPGCAVIGDKPRPMLKNRLDTAYGYLKAHPDARCVVTGGYFGAYTQAEVMKEYLVQKGISENRILVDDQSDNTSGNMKNARKLLGGDESVVIVTDVFHELRCKKFAREQGLTPYALSSATPPNHLVDAWLREYVGIVKSYALDR